MFGHIVIIIAEAMELILLELDGLTIAQSGYKFNIEILYIKYELNCI